MLSLGAFSSRCQGSRWRTFGRYTKKISHVDSKRECEALQQIDGRVELAALYVANRGPINICIDCKVLLANAALGPCRAKIPSDARATIHGSQGINLSPLIPSDISDINVVNHYTPFMSARMKATARSIFRRLQVAVALFGLVTPSVAQEDLDPLNVLGRYQGWWAFVGLSEACEISGVDTGKVAIGRYEMSHDGPVFGYGTPKLGTLDATCELHQPELVEGKIEALAICDVEGEQLVGRARFFGTTNDIEVRSPIGNFEMTRYLAVPMDQGLASPTFADGRPESADQIPSPAIPSLPNADDQPVVLANGVAVYPRPSDLAQPVLKSEGERNAIVSVYADYCDPSFLGPGSGSVDPGFYDRYKNQLMVRYAASCERYLGDQVLFITSIDTVRGFADFRPGTAGLDQKAAIFVGLWLFLSHAPEVRACGVNTQRLDPEGSYGLIASVLIARQTHTDIENVAVGYGLGLVGMRQQARFGCEAINFVLSLAENALLQSPMIRLPNL